MGHDARSRVLRFMLEHRDRRLSLGGQLRMHRAALLRAAAVHAGLVAVMAWMAGPTWAAGLAGFALGGFFSLALQLGRSIVAWDVQSAVTDWAAVERLARAEGIALPPRSPGMIE